MRTATIAEAKEQLEELIAAARAGERVEIVDEGEVPVALVLSEYAGLTPKEVELLDRLESAGLLIRGVLPPDPSAVEDLPDRPSGVLAALLAEREEGW